LSGGVAKDTRDEGRGYKGNKGDGTHIGTLNIGRARVVRDSIGGAGREHGRGELRRVV
jgi:hypothetical protein